MFKIINKTLINLELKKKIKSANVELFPFPYIDIKDGIPKFLIEEIKNFWPKDLFFSKLNGEGYRTFTLNNKSIDKLDSDISNFWKSLWKNHLNETLKLISSKFLDFHLFKHKNNIPYLGLGGAMLMEVLPRAIKFPRKGYYWMGQHTHFFHDPLWYATVLIPISGNENNGTSLYTTKSYDNFRKPLNYLNDCLDVNIFGPLAAGHNKKKINFNNSNFKVSKSIEFLPGKIFSFMDGPMSIHGVKSKKLKTEDIKTRKVLRVHLMINPLYKQYFGFNQNDVVKKMEDNEKYKKKVLTKEISKLESYYDEKKEYFKFRDITKYIKEIKLDPFEN